MDGLNEEDGPLAELRHTRRAFYIRFIYAARARSAPFWLFRPESICYSLPGFAKTKAVFSSQ